MKPFTKRQYETAINALNKIGEIIIKRQDKLNAIRIEGANPGDASNMINEIDRFLLDLESFTEELVDFQQSGEILNDSQDASENYNEKTKAQDLLMGERAEYELYKEHYPRFRREDVDKKIELLNGES